MQLLKVSTITGTWFINHDNIAAITETKAGTVIYLLRPLKDITGRVEVNAIECSETINQLTGAVPLAQPHQATTNE